MVIISSKVNLQKSGLRSDVLDDCFNALAGIPKFTLRETPTGYQVARPRPRRKGYRGSSKMEVQAWHEKWSASEREGER
jgi:hypothetical protein